VLTRRPVNGRIWQVCCWTFQFINVIIPRKLAGRKGITLVPPPRRISELLLSKVPNGPRGGAGDTRYYTFRGPVANRLLTGAAETAIHRKRATSEGTIARRVLSVPAACSNDLPQGGRRTACTVAATKAEAAGETATAGLPYRAAVHCYQEAAAGDARRKGRCQQSSGRDLGIQSEIHQLLPEEGARQQALTAPPLALMLQPGEYPAGAQ